MTDEPSTDPQRRPVYDDFRDGNNNVDWARFREAATAWDTAQVPPGSVQDPFNSPAGSRVKPHLGTVSGWCVLKAVPDLRV
jgi:hypothetical protein